MLQFRAGAAVRWLGDCVIWGSAYFLEMRDKPAPPVVHWMTDYLVSGMFARDLGGARHTFIKRQLCSSGSQEIKRYSRRG